METVIVMVTDRRGLRGTMRLDNWPAELNKIIEEHRNKPFFYGENDCCLFAAKVVLAITGIDYAEEFRGTYSSKLGALRIIGRGGMEEFMTRILKTQPKPAYNAFRGDLLLYVLEGEDHIAVCLGAKAALPVDEGLRFINTDDCVCCWNV